MMQKKKKKKKRVSDADRQKRISYSVLNIHPKNYILKKNFFSANLLEKFLFYIYIYLNLCFVSNLQV